MAYEGNDGCPCDKELTYVQDCWVNDADATAFKKMITVYEKNTFPMVVVGYLEKDRTTVANATGWTITSPCNCGCS